MKRVRIFLKRSTKSESASANNQKLGYTHNMIKKLSMMEIFKNPRYRGKHVILAAGKVYTAKTGEGAAEILKKLETTNPDVVPEVAYLPKAHSLILWL